MAITQTRDGKYIDEYTVKDHLKGIFQRIGVRKRSELCPLKIKMVVTFLNKSHHALAYPAENFGK